MMNLDYIRQKWPTLDAIFESIHIKNKKFKKYGPLSPI